VDELAAVLRPAVADEGADKLAQFERVVAGEPGGPGGFGGPPPGVGPGAVGAPPGAPAPGPGAPGAPGFGPPGFALPSTKPIRSFVVARAASVREQLDGRSAGMTVAAFGFGGPGGPPGAGGPEAPALPEGFGPGLFLGPVFLAELDADQSGAVTRAEFAAGFQRWFADWDKEGTGRLSEPALRAGLNQALNPFRNGFPGGSPGFPVPGSPPGADAGPVPGPAASPPGTGLPPGSAAGPAGAVP
jgi:hypothetical protein